MRVRRPQAGVSFVQSSIRIWTSSPDAAGAGAGPERCICQIVGRLDPLVLLHLGGMDRNNGIGMIR